jgi:hypothetical protein
MQIYFGKATDDVVDATGLNGLFVSKDSESFYIYGIDFGTRDTDEIIIYDGLDRRVPIDVDSIEDLISALEKVQEYRDQVKAAERFTHNVTSSNFSVSI